MELREIFRELESNYPDDEELIDDAALVIIKHRPHDVLDLAHEKAHAYHYSKVPRQWIDLYTEAALWEAAVLFSEQPDDWQTKMVHVLDRALIMTQDSRQELIMRALESAIPSPPESWILGESNSSVYPY